MANLVTLVGMRHGWASILFALPIVGGFNSGRKPGSEPKVSESLHDIGQEPRSVLALANATDTTAALMAETRPTAFRRLSIGNQSSKDISPLGRSRGESHFIARVVGREPGDELTMAAQPMIARSAS